MTEERKPPSPSSPPSPKRRNLEERPPSPPSYQPGGSRGRYRGSSATEGNLPIQVLVGEGSGESSGSNLDQEEQRTCSICRKVFSSVKGMYGHLWVHSVRSRSAERQPYRAKLIRAGHMFEEDLDDPEEELERDEDGDHVLDQTQIYTFDLNNPATRKDAMVFDLNKSPPKSSSDEEENGDNGDRSA